MKTLSDSLYMTERHVRFLLRQPFYIAFTLLQPMIWLIFYGQLFKRVVELPGFHATSYITFITPGVAVMSAFFGGGWIGMSMIIEIERGVMDRFLVSPVSRVAIVAGRLIYLSLTVTIQSLIIVTVGFVLGARFAGGPAGIAALFASAVLLAAPFGALSIALAVTMRRQESVIAASNFVMLPLTFLSPVFMAKDLMPAWIRNVTLINPVAWAVEASRTALGAAPDWGLVLSRLGFLLAFSLLCASVATRAFRAYQRSV